MALRAWSRECARSRAGRAFHQALASYVPRPYPGKVDLVLAEEGLAFELGDAIGNEWKRRSSVVDVHVVPGTHLTVMDEPNVAALAEVLERLLAACDARSEAPAPVAASLAEAGRR